MALGGGRCAAPLGRGEGNGGREHGCAEQVAEAALDPEPVHDVLLATGLDHAVVERDDRRDGERRSLARRGGA